MRRLLAYYKEKLAVPGNVTDISSIQTLDEYCSAIIPDRCKDVVIAFYVKTANNPNPQRLVVLTKERGGDWEVINEGI